MRSALALAGAFAALFALVAACGSSSKGSGFAGGGDLDASNGDAPTFNDPDANTGPIVSDGGVFNDGAIDAEPSCTPDAGGPGPVQRVCLASTDNECDGNHDLLGFPPNGTGGNGFDDDCDGLVDEGCKCTAPGITKDCYLVPASQTLGGVPVGWCAQNSKGTVDCVKPSTEFDGTWSGVCRGAQPPFADDFCAKGDFNCDGKDENSKAHDCTCGPGSVQCPTNPLTTVPYPPPSQLPLKVDGASWFQNPSEASQATNWKWTLLGGDCDNVLPHPTYGIYATQDGSGNPLGTQSNTLGQSQKEHGMIATQPDVTSSIYPAFSLSGDYIATGEFDLFGKHYSCTQKIQVRAPGIRAEACWDTEPQGVDLDIHMSRVDGFSTCPNKGWSGTCANEDCYYGSCYGSSSVQWNYQASGSSACQGWGSQTTGTCNNPRLDRDANGLSGSCSSSITNPNDNGGSLSGNIFCGPENINVDAPADGSKYAVAVKYYGDASSVGASRPHVNVYCNGERVLSTGFNPVTGVNFPVMTTAGGDSLGDMWKVGFITAHVSGNTLTCDVAPTSAGVPRAASDGPAYCVDDTGTDTAQCVQYLASGGAAPLNANAMCFH